MAQVSDFEVVIGIETHIQLQTQTKLFCACPATFSTGENTHVCPVCMGFPGALPVLNEAVVGMAVKIGLALNCQIDTASVFARKNYFYPDSPKAYQISQHKRPICYDGYLDVELNGFTRRIGITRIHMEEDAGKSTHMGTATGINFNRSSVPLLEIVTAPDLRTPQEAAAYVKELRSIVRYLDICDGNMEEGSLRADCNISLRRRGDSQLGTRVEIKNLNSFRFIEKALSFEVLRQQDLLEQGQGSQIRQETRLYDPDKNRTQVMREKEEAEDYRYFPEPDLGPCRITSEQMRQWQAESIELPATRRQKIQQDHGISSDAAELLTQERDTADYYQALVDRGIPPRLAANWVIQELLPLRKERQSLGQAAFLDIDTCVELLDLLEKGRIHSGQAKDLLPLLLESGESPQQIMDRLGWTQALGRDNIASWVEEVLQSHPEQVSEYLSGKDKVLTFFVGKIMRLSKGQAAPGVVNELLLASLEERKGNQQ